MAEFFNLKNFNSFNSHSQESKHIFLFSKRSINNSDKNNTNYETKLENYN